MSYKRLGMIVLMVLAVVIGALIYIRDNVIEKPHPALDITDLSALYQAEDEIEEARALRGMPDAQPAEVVTAQPPDLPMVAIVFDGLPDRALTSRFLDVLARHKAPAVFFVEGANAADQPETIEAIHEAGQEIGNYTFVGLVGVEKQPVEEQLAQICRAQKAIVTFGQDPPRFFRAPRTQYSHELLLSVKAAGIPYAVDANTVFQEEGVETKEAAALQANALPMGSILAIPISRVVEPKVDAPVVVDSKPAVDMKPTIKDNQAAKHPPKADLADKLDWFLSALEGRGIQFAPLGQYCNPHQVPAIPLPVKEGE